MNAYIFDMDGTILNSMHYWYNFGAEFLKAKGLSDDYPKEKLERLTLFQALAMFKEEFSMRETVEELNAEAFELLYQHYRHSFTLKEGTLELFEHIRGKGGKIALATATERRLVNGFMERYPEAAVYFDLIETVEPNTWTKNDPEFFEGVVERFGETPEKVFVFEDAPHAMETAKKAGYTVIGILGETLPELRARGLAAADFAFEDIRSVDLGILSL